jgi:hypothetical protein
MNTRTISNDFLELEYLTVTLRTIGLTTKGKTNLFANLSAYPSIPKPYGDFYFRGGHCLWHVPEAMPRTYALDTGGLTIIELKDGVILDDQTESETGISKRIEIRLVPDKPSITLTHALINHGL